MTNPQTMIERATAGATTSRAMTDHQTTGEEKFQMVRDQFTGADPDLPFDIWCPYCYGRCVQNEQLCCDTMLHAMQALVDAQTVLRNIQIAEEAMDRVASQSKKVLLAH